MQCVFLRMLTFLPVPTGDQEDNLYHKSHWKSERENQEVHQIKTFVSFWWCPKKDGLSFAYGDWEKMDDAHFELGLDYEPIYAYLWKQNSDISRTYNWILFPFTQKWYKKDGVPPILNLFIFLVWILCYHACISFKFFMCVSLESVLYKKNFFRDFFY